MTLRSEDGGMADTISKKEPDERSSFVHGVCSQKSAGESVGRCFRRTTGVAAFLDQRNERVYKSFEREPLGKSRIFGYSLPSPNHTYGKPLGEHEVIKTVINPEHSSETPNTHRQYVRTHLDFSPGEQVDREYRWPEQVLHASAGFAFGFKPNWSSGSAAEAFDWKPHKPNFVSERWQAFHSATQAPIGKTKPMVPGFVAKLPTQIKPDPRCESAGECINPIT